LSATDEKLLFIWDSLALTPAKSDIEGDYNPNSSIGVKARKLFMADAISVNDVTKLEEIMKRAHRKL